MKRPPSCGQHFRIGRIGSVSLTAVEFGRGAVVEAMDHFLARALFTFFGRAWSRLRPCFRRLQPSRRSVGGLAFRISCISCARSSMLSTCNASAMRRSRAHGVDRHREARRACRR